MTGTAKSEKYSELIQALQKFNSSIENSCVQMNNAVTVAMAAMGSDHISSKAAEKTKEAISKYRAVETKASDLMKKLSSERQKIIEIENQANNF